MLNNKSRSKVEEILQAEKVIADLKFVQACTTLIAYANTLKNNGSIIAESEGNPLKLQELLLYIFSVVYAAQHLGLSSLNEFKQLMVNYFGTETVQIAMEQVDPKIVEAFKVKSTPVELNTYFLEMSERNTIPLEQINVIGHNFTHHFTGVPQTNPQLNPNLNPQNNNQNNPYPIQQQQQPHVYNGNPYRNSINPQGPNFNNPQQNQNGGHTNNNNMGNFNYPTE